MIGFVPQYYGWLGNQMFQYACVKALSLREGVECSFPEKNPNLHEIFNLNCFTTFDTPSNNLVAVYREPSFEYREIPLNIPKHLILSGYFQSEKYFKKFESAIRKDFTFREKIDCHIPPKTCGVHVRRGDYVKNQNQHPLCSLSYYQKAMEAIDADFYMIFSDDPDWCSSNFKQKNHTVVRGNSPERDMQLMSKCDSNIIANSSFSWWAAWLNTRNTGKVIAPNKWFGDKSSNNPKDIYCEDWLVL